MEELLSCWGGASNQRSRLTPTPGFLGESHTKQAHGSESTLPCNTSHQGADSGGGSGYRSITGVTSMLGTPLLIVTIATPHTFTHRSA